MYPVIAVLVLAALIFLYYKFVKPLSYWKEHGVPQQHPLTIIKEILTSFTNPPGLAQTFENLCKSFPDKRYFGIYQYFGKALIVQDPDLIKRITVKDFDHFTDHVRYSTSDEPFWERSLFALKGEQWKGMRLILSPSFTSSKMKMMFNLMGNSMDNFTTYFEEELRDKNCVAKEMKEVFLRFANDIIASMAFGYTCDSLRDPQNEFYFNAKDILFKDTLLQNLKTYVMFNYPEIAKKFNFTRISKKATSFFWEIIRENVKTREEKGIVRHDMLHLLIKEKKNRAQSGLKDEITDMDITAQSLLFFFAGFESISALMSFVAYELALNVDIQKRLQDEVDQTMKNCEGTVTYDALFKMQYMDMVISESLRKWPIAIVTDRVCTKPYVIQPEKSGEVPVHLKEGDLVWLPMHGIQWNPTLFPNPDKFDPERFSEKNKSKINPYAYIPFGSGPRSCIASRFTLMETKLLFFKILTKFDIVVVEKSTVPIELANSSVSLFVKGGFWLGFKLRDC